MNEHFGSQERMVYPAVAELVGEPLQALGFESRVAASAATGLSFAKGGAIEVESALGAGTTFTIRLPRVAAPEVDCSQPA